MPGGGERARCAELLAALRRRCDGAGGEQAAERAAEWAVTRGLVVADRERRGRVLHAPFTLLPTPFPKWLFDRVAALQPTLNTVYDRVARDATFLDETLRGTGAADPFTGRLVSLHQELYLGKEPPQPLMLGMFRADYMLNAAGSGGGAGADAWAGADGWGIQQVEVNTISSAFAGLSPSTNRLHRYTTTRLLADMDDCDVGAGCGAELEGMLPVSKSEEAFPDALAAAARAVAARRPAATPGAAQPAKRPRVTGGGRPHVLFVVQPGETNTGDQRRLEAALWERHGVPSLRRSLQQVRAEGELGPGGELRVGGVPCHVVYFRAGYTPTDYPTEECWEARHLMERSTAVKCPSVPYHLVGTKKVQQVLTDPAVLRRFCHADDAAALGGVFAPIHALSDTPESNERIRRAAAAPAEWVVKPQREGGGTLLHGDAMVKMLRTLSSADRDEYILMRKIVPPRLPNVIVRDRALIRDDRTVSELGMFGAILSDGAGAALHNELAGHLLRTKSERDEDGGVAAGVACLDSPALVPY